MRHAELLAQSLSGRVDVDADDHVRVDQARALDDIEADAAKPEDDDVVAGFHFGRVDDGADSRRHAAADIADLVERRVLANPGQRDFGQYRVVGERRGAHVVEQPVLADGETAGSVRHHTLTLGSPDRLTEIRLAGCAVLALTAFRRIERNDMVGFLQRSHAGTRIDHHAGAFVAENRRKQALRIRPGTRELVGMADAGRLDLDQDFAFLWPIKIDGLDAERLARFPGDGGFRFHGCPLPTSSYFDTSTPIRRSRNNIRDTCSESNIFLEIVWRSNEVWLWLFVALVLQCRNQYQDNFRFWLISGSMTAPER